MRTTDPPLCFGLGYLLQILSPPLCFGLGGPVLLLTIIPPPVLRPGDVQLLTQGTFWVPFVLDLLRRLRHPQQNV